MDEDVKKHREYVFDQYPVLHTLLEIGCLKAQAQRTLTDGVTLPQSLQQAVDEGNMKNVAGHFGLTPKQLRHIPVSSVLEFSSFTAIALVKAGIINPDLLSTNPAHHEAVCRTLQSCFTLADELGFTFDQNDPNTYPPFLTHVIQATAAKGPLGWGDMVKALPEQLYDDNSQPNGIEDMVNDYVNTVFLPYAVQGKLEYDVNKEQQALFPQAVTQFFKGVPIDTIAQLSTKWHDTARRVHLLQAKTFSGADWEPLFAGVQTYGEVVATPLTNSTELSQEGCDLKHCVGGYSGACLFMHSHIVSMRDGQGKPLSTIEFKVVSGKTDSTDSKVISIPGQDKYYLMVRQHYGERNETPSDQAKEAAEALCKDMRSGKVKVDLEGLERKHTEREEIFRNKKEIVLIGYDPKDTKSMENARAIYRGEHGLGNISRTLKHNFDVLTGQAKEKEKEQEQEQEQSFAQKIGKKSSDVSSIEASIQAFMHNLLSEGVVKVAVEGKPRDGKVTVTLADNDNINSLHKVQHALETQSSGLKAKFETRIDGNQLHITKPMPLTVSQILGVKAVNSSRGL